MIIFIGDSHVIAYYCVTTKQLNRLFMENEKAEPAGDCVPKNEGLRQMFQSAFDLFPKGNPEVAYNLLVYHARMNKTFDGKPVTVELIIDKWKEYVGMCATENRSPMYTKSMERFIESKDYNINFQPKMGTSSFLDKYLDS